MKYIPILSSRDAELQIYSEIKNSNIIPYIKLIKSKFRNNSKRDFIDDFKSVKNPFFVEVAYSTNPGNVKDEVAYFLKDMCDNDKYFDFVSKLSENEQASIVLPIRKIVNLSTTQISKLKNISLRFETAQELSYLSIAQDVIFKNAFIDFDPTILEGLAANLFSNFFNLYKSKIVFIFKNHELKLKNIDVDQKGKIYPNKIVSHYENFGNVFGFSDYCMLAAEDLPASGGVLSPGIKIQISMDKLLHVGDSILSIKDAVFAGYTNSVKALFKNINYQNNIDNFISSPSFALVKEANITSNKHLITPLKAKYISMSHYIELISKLILKSSI